MRLHASDHRTTLGFLKVVRLLANAWLLLLLLWQFQCMAVLSGAFMRASMGMVRIFCFQHQGLADQARVAV